MLTQRPLIAALPRRAGAGRVGPAASTTSSHGLNDGARNMIGIGVATATAGIIVGGITLTGLGLRMTEFVEFVSQGNVIVMLLFIAFVCLVLGLGVPTTANYVLVATLMAPVVVELGAQSGLVIPLIAVHLFVFYYGIMGDITPPVGLATFAAAAISGEDAIATGIQGSIYALRTVILPFIWIFNPQLLLIDIDSISELVIVVVASITAMLIFAACTMSWFRVRCRAWEVAVLALACFLLFRPDYFMDLLAPEFVQLPAARLYDVARDVPTGGRVVMVIQRPDDRRRRRAEDRRGAARTRRRRRAQAPRRRGSHVHGAGRRAEGLGREVRIARAEGRHRPGLRRGAHRGAVGPRVGLLVLPARVRADRAGLVVAGTAHAADGRTGRCRAWLT